MLDLAQFAGLGAIPIVIAIVQIIKTQVLMPDAPNWTNVAAAFAVSEVLDVGLAYILHTDLPTAATVAVFVWLSAMGAWSGVKTSLSSGPSAR